MKNCVRKFEALSCDFCLTAIFSLARIKLRIDLSSVPNDGRNLVRLGVHTP
jgi:hypothetical protein